MQVYVKLHRRRLSLLYVILKNTVRATRNFSADHMLPTLDATNLKLFSFVRPSFGFTKLTIIASTKNSLKFELIKKPKALKIDFELLKIDSKMVLRSILNCSSN